MQEALARSGCTLLSHVYNFKGPSPGDRLTPEMYREERPLVKSGAQGISGPGEEKGGFGARRGYEDKHDVATGHVVKAHLALDML